MPLRDNGPRTACNPNAMDTDELVAKWLHRFRPLAWTCDLRDLTLVTYAVPARRLRSRIPDELQLETFSDESGTERAFVSIGLFEVRGLRPLMAPAPSSDFREITYRTYVRYRGRPGVFFLRIEFSASIGSAGQAVIAKNAAFSRIHHEGARWISSSNSGLCAVSLPPEPSSAPTQWASKTPFDSHETASDFLSHRLLGFFLSRAGTLTVQAVAHGRMSPFPTTLLDARADSLERTGILRLPELDRPFLVTQEPQVRFHLLPPFPAKWIMPGNSEPSEASHPRAA